MWTEEMYQQTRLRWVQSAKQASTSYLLDQDKARYRAFSGLFQNWLEEVRYRRMKELEQGLYDAQCYCHESLERDHCFNTCSLLVKGHHMSLKSDT